MEPLRPGDPKEVGSYRLEGRLGSGGMGEVFLGRSRGGRPVAVKTVRSDLARDPGFRRRFALEAEAARRVGGFYTAQVVDADLDADPPWLVTAYIPGPSLREAVESHGPLPAAGLSLLGPGLAEGLAAIHRCGLVHRDLKPSNVVLAEDGPRIIDFGIARALDVTSHTTPRTVLGTPSFMSPEQARGDAAGPPSDVFSLGTVLVYAATGRTPFGTGPAHALPYRIVHEEPDLSGVPALLRDVIAACLVKDPAARPTVADLLDRLPAPDAARRLLPDPAAEIIEQRSTMDAPPVTTAESSRTAPTQATEHATLNVGNLSGLKLDIFIDGSLMGRADAYENRIITTETGDRSVQVKARRMLSLPEQINVRPGVTSRIAFEVPGNYPALPAPADAVTFTGSTTKGATVTGSITGFALIILLLALLVGLRGWGGLLEGKEVGGIIMAGLLFGLAGSAWHFWEFRRERLTLRSSDLTFVPTLRWKRDAETIRWDDLERVGLVDGGLVVWYRREEALPADVPDEGTTVCKLKNLTGHHDVLRLRAALQWFGGDLYAEPPG